MKKEKTSYKLFSTNQWQKTSPIGVLKEPRLLEILKMLLVVEAKVEKINFHD